MGFISQRMGSLMNESILKLSRDGEVQHMLNVDVLANCFFNQMIRDPEATPEAFWRQLALLQSAAKRDVIESVSRSALYGKLPPIIKNIR